MSGTYNEKELNNLSASDEYLVTDQQLQQNCDAEQYALMMESINQDIKDEIDTNQAKLAEVKNNLLNIEQAMATSCIALQSLILDIETKEKSLNTLNNLIHQHQDNLSMLSTEINNKYIEIDNLDQKVSELRQQQSALELYKANLVNAGYNSIELLDDNQQPLCHAANIKEQLHNKLSSATQETTIHSLAKYIILTLLCLVICLLIYAGKRQHIKSNKNNAANK